MTTERIFQIADKYLREYKQHKEERPDDAWLLAHIGGAIEFALKEQNIEQAKNFVLTDIKGISMRLFNLSMAARIETLGDLQKFRKEDLYKFNGIGKKTVSEIENILQTHGLDFLY